MKLFWLYIIIALFSEIIFSQMFTDSNIILPRISNGSCDLGDYDNDGDLDIILTGSGLSKIFRNDSLNFIESVSLIGLSNSSCKWGDYDNDGDLDIIIGGSPGENSGGILKVYQNNGNGSFTDINANFKHVTIGWGQCHVSWGDCDNDGDLDILCVGSYYTTSGDEKFSNIYYNNNGTFFDAEIGLPGFREEGSAEFIDFDNDSDLDIFINGYCPTLGGVTSILYRNEGNMIFSSVNTNIIGTDYSSANWGDYDNDGDLDILVSGDIGYETCKSSIFRNDGNGIFQDIEAGLIGLWHSVSMWGDYDNDGDLDVLIGGLTSYGQGCSSSRVTKMYINDNGIFTEIETEIPDVYESFFQRGDYDNDGDLDIIVLTDCLLNSKVYINNINTVNVSPQPPSNLMSIVHKDSVFLQWDGASDDETPVLGLSYNIRVSTVEYEDNLVASHAFLSNGKRKVVRIGNCQENTSWVINNLETGKYFWNVQSIDASYSGSCWADEYVFNVDVTSPARPENLQALCKEEEITLSWQSNTESDLYFYKIYRDILSPAVTCIDTVYHLNSSENPVYSDIHLTDGYKRYYYHVTAVDSLGNESDFSNEVNIQPNLIQSISPYQNENNVGKNLTIHVNFYFTIDSSTINDSTFIVYASQSGIHRGQYRYTEKTIEFLPYHNFFPGENVTVTLTNRVKTITGDSLKKAFLWSFEIGTIKGNVAFQNRIDYPVGGNESNCISAGDFNNDSNVDLAITGFVTFSTMILLNNGDGTFNNNNIPYTDLYTYHTISDFNNDTYLDIALITYLGDAISIMFNDNVGYQRYLYNTDTNNSTFIFTNDFNGNSFRDLVFAREDISQIAICYNDNSEFNITNNYSIGSQSYSCTSSDFDNDGDFDVATANYSSYSISILFNDGNGVFSNRKDYLVGTRPMSIFSSDFNNDGYVDIVTANNGSNNISVLLNNFGDFKPKIDYTVGNKPNKVISADLNGDSNIDIVVLNSGSNTISLLFNDGSAVFKIENELNCGPNPSSISCSDLDNDGDLDLAVANRDSNTFSIFFNRNIISPSISILTDSILFSDTQLNESSVINLNISNTSFDSLLYVYDFRMSNFNFFIHTIDTIIEPDNNIFIQIYFTPNNIGLVTNSLIFKSNDPINPEIKIQIYGTGIDTLAPRAPQNLQCLPGNMETYLSWLPNSETDLRQYNIYRNTISPATQILDSVLVLSPSDTLYHDTDLTNGQKYYYRITAVDSLGNESIFSNEVSAIPVSKEIWLSDIQYEFCDVQIDSNKTWRFCINNVGTDSIKIGDITNALLEFVVIPRSGQISPSDSLEISVTFQPIGLINYTDTLRIYSNDSDDEDTIKYVYLSGAGIDTLAPEVPQNLQCLSGNEEVNLTWLQNTETDLRQYNIYRNTISPATQILDSVLVLSPSDTLYHDTDLTNGQKYYYRITAVDSLGNESDFSNEVEAIPVSKEIYLSDIQHAFYAIQIDSVKSWEFTINNVGTDSISIYDITNTQPEYIVIPRSGRVNPSESLEISVTFQPTGLINYADTLRIYSNDSDDEDTIKYIYLSGTGIDTLAPSVPQNVVATTENVSVTLNWSGNQENDFHHYNIYRSEYSQALFLLDSVMSYEPTIYTDSCLSYAKKYHYRLTALDSLDNESDFSNEICFSTNHIPVLSLSDIADEKSDSINAHFVLKDTPDDILSLEFYYSLNNGEDWNDCNIFGKYNNLFVSLFDSLLFDSVKWHSDQDLPNIEYDSVWFCCIPSDRWIEGIGDTIVIHIDNETGPQIVNVDKVIYPLNNQSVLTRFDRPIDISSLLTNPNNIQLTSKISGILQDSIEYLPLTKTLCVFSQNGFYSMDTLALTLSGLITDTLGKGLDGNRNGDPEGPGIDDTTITVYTQMLLDFDNNGTVNDYDINQFVHGWRLNDFNCELGPTEGELPHLRVIPDQRFNIEDLMSFIFVYNWMDDKKVLSKSIIGEKYDQRLIYHWNGHDLSFGLSGIRDISCFRYEITYDHNYLSMLESKVIITDPELNGKVLNFSESVDSLDTHSTQLVFIKSPNIGSDSVFISSIPVSFHNEYKTTITIDYIYFDNERANVGSKQITLHPIPTEYVLFQNYPNPFNPNTKIKYGIPEMTDVKVKIYNVLGQQVRSWDFNNQSPGYYEIIWDSKTDFDTYVSSGVYFYCINTSDFRQVKKCLLIK